MIFAAVGREAVGVLSRDELIAQMDVFSSAAWLVRVLNDATLGSLLVFALAAIVVIEVSAR